MSYSGVRNRGRAVAVLALAASLLLTGCTPAPTLPEGVRPSDIKALIAERNLSWWQGMFVNQPPPVVEPVEHVSPDEVDSRIQACILDAGLPGTGVTYEGALTFTSPDQGETDAFWRQSYVCTLTYPYDLSDPAALGYLSAAQTTYLYRYYKQRLVPCLMSLGFTFDEKPTSKTYRQSIDNFWMPYYDLVPAPTSAAEWNLIDLRCPPPPYLADARPGPDGAIPAGPR